MFWFIIGIVVLVVGAIWAIYEIWDDEKGFAAGVAAGTIIICGVLLGLSCFRSVPVGHTGVVTVFGKVKNYTLDSGAHLTAPWEKVVNMDNRVQKATVELPCFSSDIQEVNVSYTLNYQISKADAMTLYSTVGKEYYETVVAPNVAESVKVVTARYTAEELVGMRNDLAAAIEVVLGEKMEQFNIEIRSTSIENMDFTDVFTNAVEAKQVAQQEKMRAQTEAEQKIIEAKANAEARLIQVESEAEANRLINESMTETVLKNKFYNVWNGQLPNVMGDGTVITNIAGN